MVNLYKIIIKFEYFYIKLRIISKDKYINLIKLLFTIQLKYNLIHKIYIYIRL